MALQTYKVKGEAYWAMVLGEPRPTYSGDNREWTVDLKLNKAGVKAIKDLGMEQRIKDNRDHSPFIRFARVETKKGGPNAGQENKPIPITDMFGKPWDQDKLIGNGSKIEVEFATYIPIFKGKKFPPKPNVLKIVVLEHVPYVSPGDVDVVTNQPEVEDWQAA